MRALHLSERTWLRLGSRLAATLLVTTSASILLLQRQATIPAPGAEASAIAISMVSWRRPPIAMRSERRAVPPPEHAAPEALRVAAPEQDAGGGGSALWFNGAQGRVAFRDGAHYLRCLNARLDRREDQDCPPLDDAIDLHSDAARFEIASER